MKTILVLAVCGMACGSTAPVAQEPAAVPRVIRGPAETPYAVYELSLAQHDRLRLPATGELRCAISPAGAFSLSRSTSWVDVRNIDYEGWSMLRLVHDTGARTLYRFYTSAETREPGPSCDGSCIHLSVGEQEMYPAAGVSRYSEGPPNVVDVRVTTTEFVFVALREGRTTLLLIMDDGSQRLLRFEVHGPRHEAPAEPPPDAPRECTGACDAGECVEGFCATWEPIDCAIP